MINSKIFSAGLYKILELTPGPQSAIISWCTQSPRKAIMELSSTQYELELETLLTKTLLPRYIAVCEKYGEPFPWHLIPPHLLISVKKSPTKVCRLLEAEFRI